MIRTHQLKFLATSLEVEDENLLTPEESPTHEQQQWETIETMVFNGNQATLVPK